MEGLRADGAATGLGEVHHEVWVFYRETRRVLTHFAGRDEVEIGRTHIRSRVLAEVSKIPLSEIWLP